MTAIRIERKMNIMTDRKSVQHGNGTQEVNSWPKKRGDSKEKGKSWKNDKRWPPRTMSSVWLCGRWSQNCPCWRWQMEILEYVSSRARPTLRCWVRRPKDDFKVESKTSLFTNYLFTNYLQIIYKKKIDLQNQFWIEFVNPSSATLDGFSV